MPTEVRKLWFGIAVLAVAIYVGQDPNGLLVNLPLFRLFTGGVFLATISLFMLEAGWRFLAESEANRIDRALGFVQFIVGAGLLGGFTYAAYQANRPDVLWAVAIGALFYFFFIRGPVVSLYRG